MFKVHIGYTAKGRDRWAKFDSITNANSFCEAVFKRSGRVLSIVAG